MLPLSHLESIGQQMLDTMFHEFRPLGLTEALYILDYIGQRIVGYANSDASMKVKANEKERATVNQMIINRTVALSGLNQVAAGSS